MTSSATRIWGRCIRRRSERKKKRSRKSMHTPLGILFRSRCLSRFFANSIFHILVSSFDDENVLSWFVIFHAATSPRGWYPYIVRVVDVVLFSVWHRPHWLCVPPSTYHAVCRVTVDTVNDTENTDAECSSKHSIPIFPFSHSKQCPSVSSFLYWGWWWWCAHENLVTHNTKHTPRREAINLSVFCVCVFRRCLCHRCHSLGKFRSFVRWWCPNRVVLSLAQCDIAHMCSSNLGPCACVSFCFYTPIQGAWPNGWQAKMLLLFCPDRPASAIDRTLFWFVFTIFVWHCEEPFRCYLSLSWSCLGWFIIRHSVEWFLLQITTGMPGARVSVHSPEWHTEAAPMQCSHSLNTQHFSVDGPEHNRHDADIYI